LNVLGTLGTSIAGFMSGQVLFFKTSQVVFVLLGAYGIWKIREKMIGSRGFDK